MSATCSWIVCVHGDNDNDNDKDDADSNGNADMYMIGSTTTIVMSVLKSA